MGPAFPSLPHGVHWIEQSGLGTGERSLYFVANGLPVATLEYVEPWCGYDGDLRSCGAWRCPSLLVVADRTVVADVGFLSRFEVFR